MNGSAPEKSRISVRVLKLLFQLSALFLPDFRVLLVGYSYCNSQQKLRPYSYWLKSVHKHSINIMTPRIFESTSPQKEI